MLFRIIVVIITMISVRVVCQNTLNLALGTAKHIWTARHTENVLLRVQDARETLQLANSYMGELGVCLGGGEKAVSRCQLRG